MLKQWLKRPLVTESSLSDALPNSTVYPTNNNHLSGALSTLLQQSLTERLSTSPAGNILLDAEFHVLWFNPLAAQWLGLNEHDTHRPLTHLIRSPLLSNFLRSDAHRITLEHEKFRLRFQHILLIPGSLSLLQVESVEDREAIHRAQRNFLAAVSHELNTPLTVIRGFIELLEYKLPDQIDIFNRLHQQIQRLSGLSSQLLQLLRTEQASPRFRSLDTQSFFNRIKEDINASNIQGRTIMWNIEKNLTLYGDELSLYSAFKNLIDNAIRYTDPEAGKIRVAWYLSPQNNSIFEVEDNGIGIHTHHLPRLGERFYRAHDLPALGTGLGLSIVKQAIQQHQGELQIQSTLHKGSLFRIQLRPYTI